MKPFQTTCFLSTIASFFLVGCGSKEYTTQRPFEVTGMTGNQQYSATIDINMTAHKLLSVGDYSAQFNRHDSQVVQIVNRAAATLPDTQGDDALLEENVKAAIEKQLPEINAKTFGYVSADSVTVLSVTNLFLGCQQSFTTFMNANSNYYEGGSCSGQDSDLDGYISVDTNRLNTTPGQLPFVTLQCATNGSGCKIDKSSKTLPSTFNPQQPH